MSKSICKTLESIFRLSVAVEKGVILGKARYSVKFSTEEPVQSTAREFVKSYGEVSTHTPEGKAESHSPSRDLKVIFREGEKKTENFLELWEGHRLRQVKNLKEIHSELNVSPVFGRATWSSDEKYIAYIAESLPEKTGSFWSDSENPGAEHTYKEDFGETLGGFTAPALWLYSVEENTIERIEVTSEYPAQPCFLPGTHQLFFIGYTKYAYKLGLNFMLNRENALMVCDLGTKEVSYVECGDSLMGVLFPKANQSGTLLAYFGVPKGAICHAFCLSLFFYDLSLGTHTEVIPLVEAPKPGVFGYHDSLARSGWLTDEIFVFETLHRVNECVFSVQKDGFLSEIAHPLSDIYSNKILDIHSNLLLFASSSFNTLPCVCVAEYSNDWTYTVLEKNCFHPKSLIEQEIVGTLKACTAQRIPHLKSLVESILYIKDPASPLVLIPHGGPHSHAAPSYACSISLRLFNSYNVLLCNYRGSLGFGQSTVTSLLGHVGVMDLEDCLEALELAKQYVSTDKVVSIGGSHGGFLSGHLAATGKVSASVILNGVLNMSLGAYLTDITDWTYAEALNSAIKPAATPEELRICYEKSPIAKVNEIEVPVLIVAGGSDARVSPENSVEFYRALRAAEKDVQMLWYGADGHSLAGKATAYDCLVNVEAWIEEKLNR